MKQQVPGTTWYDSFLKKEKEKLCIYPYILKSLLGDVL